MPRKPPTPDAAPVPDKDASSAGNVAVPLPPSPAPIPAAPAETTTATRTRTQRTRRLVWLSVGFTTLVGAVWTALASSMVDGTRSYFEAMLQDLQGVNEIKRLNEEMAQVQAEHVAVLTRKQTEYDTLLANTGIGLTAYVHLPFRSRQFCLDEARSWARESGYVVTDAPDPTLFIITVKYFGASLELRCVGAAFGNITFLLVTGTAPTKKRLDAAHATLVARLARFNEYPAVVSPDDATWVTSGPFMEVAFVKFDVSYAEFLDWQSGRFPRAIVTTLTRPSTRVRAYTANNWGYFTVDEPGSSLTLRTPGLNSYLLLAPDGTWKMAVDVLPLNTVPTADTRVQAEVMVAWSGLNYGQYSVDSLGARYLAQDAIDRLSTVPGIVDGGKFASVLRSW